MKSIISILFLVLTTSYVFAGDTTGKSEKDKVEKENYKYDPDTHKSGETTLEKTETARETKTSQNESQSENDPDSSYYSVNKFNYLFYFVYKIKYMSDEVPEVELGL
ncbi:hypothetical protein BFP72_14620 [Reichenbachiella sp. 5M10]|uniref:hypothetical protein n=1 Tax=Reichenbachiella sp. 5M10 TaxID=1889772 RepID=UPI000C1455CE|nr:hypothetical protein [Reichenbachiella sp. 5M10]PIB36545.1 hypothetical protein BFP72_14620 [Reichenbachiella sp. 5M10]